MNTIEIRGLTKSYGPNSVLRGVDLTVEAGEWVALMGPSGCGKSTLLNLTGGLDSADSGSISVAGQRVDCLNASQRAEMRRATVGIVFQSFNLVPHLDIASNIELPMRLAGVGRSEARRRAAELLSGLDLGEQLKSSPAKLSGGQQQRVALARALANRPAILLADEPTGSLDSASAATVLRLMAAEHARGQTILMVTHDYKVASAADRIVRMADGLIVEDQPTVDPESYVDELIGATRPSAFARLVSYE